MGNVWVAGAFTGSPCMGCTGKPCMGCTPCTGKPCMGCMGNGLCPCTGIWGVQARVFLNSPKATPVVYVSVNGRFFVT